MFGYQHQKLEDIRVTVVDFMLKNLLFDEFCLLCSKGQESEFGSAMASSARVERRSLDSLREAKSKTIECTDRDERLKFTGSLDVKPTSCREEPRRRNSFESPEQPVRCNVLERRKSFDRLSKGLSSVVGETVADRYETQSGALHRLFKSEKLDFNKVMASLRKIS